MSTIWSIEFSYEIFITKRMKRLFRFDTYKRKRNSLIWLTYDLAPEMANEIPTIFQTNKIRQFEDRIQCDRYKKNWGNKSKMNLNKLLRFIAITQNVFMKYNRFKILVWARGKYDRWHFTFRLTLIRCSGFWWMSFPVKRPQKVQEIYQ